MSEPEVPPVLPERGRGLARMIESLGAIVVGQEQVIADVVTAYLARGHVLLEGVPGVAKTLLARTFSAMLGLEHARVQFTPDLMPSDILGTSVWRPATQTFELLRGPVFTQVLLADEVNRTSPKTQAALLECMEERQVTLDGRTHALDPSFFVIATQNPLELEGTYPLPEAQLDRFLMRVRVGYPALDAEVQAAQAFHRRQGRPPHVTALLTAAELSALRAQAGEVRCDDSVVRYAVMLARHTRENPRVRLGASPRAAQALLAAAKARAVLSGRDFVTPDEVKASLPSVFNHRLLLSAESEVEGLRVDDVLAHTLEQVEVPR